MFGLKEEKEKIGLIGKKAREIRASVVEMLIEAGSGHTAGSLGMADVFAVLYFGGVLKQDPKRPDWEERDRLILSNGHICPVLYASMAHAGYFPVEELKTLRKFGSRLQGHPHREFLPALENSSGPLGSGLSQAVGMALADKMDAKKDRKIFCLMSDGEQDCGNVWEAAMLASHNVLENLIAIIDRNRIQIDGFTEDVLEIEPLSEKWSAFGWRVLEVDGHDVPKLLKVFEEARHSDFFRHRPTVVIAKTIPGKGVSDWENKYEWHGKAPTAEEGNKALLEIRKG